MVRKETETPGVSCCASGVTSGTGSGKQIPPPDDAEWYEDMSLLLRVVIVQGRLAPQLAKAFTQSSGACPILQTADRGAACHRKVFLRGCNFRERLCRLDCPRHPIMRAPGPSTQACFRLTRLQPGRAPSFRHMCRACGPVFNLNWQTRHRLRLVVPPGTQRPVQRQRKLVSGSACAWALRLPKPCMQKGMP